jgi:hypothetical protein
MGNKKNNDIISEQSFVNEQVSGRAKNARRFQSIEAIEDREFEDRLSVQTAVGLEDLDSAISPQADSPGDSEEDATDEFLMGMNFRPAGEDAFEVEEDEDVENFEKTDKTVYSEQKSASASETPSSEKAEDGNFANRDIETLENNDASVISSGRPSPRSDSNRVSSTN